ncbi:alpha/beta family hydrolase [Aliidiomarina indica]|uniref:alpha/beta family hydrolase n=1 Tax=Aliidiomarina indica TaxID=2749147 RepID=UPI0018905A59|nr:alpha/beta family hydrolase [Aliidiomarina indica]
MVHIAFAHGAGAGHDSDFMRNISRLLEDKGYIVQRVTFPYWQKVQQTGKKRPPDRAAILDQHFIDVVQQRRDDTQPLFVMGKSMGARVAARTAKTLNAQGMIGLGFPFHPPGKQERHRIDDLACAEVPSLIIQGSRDPFGNASWVTSQTLPKFASVHWVDAANHDLVAPKRTGVSPEAGWQQVVAMIDQFIQERIN